jgi:hypothetical protein
VAAFLPNAAAAVNHLVISLSISGIADQAPEFGGGKAAHDRGGELSTKRLTKNRTQAYTHFVGHSPSVGDR